MEIVSALFERTALLILCGTFGYVACALFDRAVIWLLKLSPSER